MVVRMSWSAKQYVAFESERTRPVRDLLAAVPTTEVRRAVAEALGKLGPGSEAEASLLAALGGLLEDRTAGGQVAITAVCSVIELFWALANPGVQGGIIADRGDNLERLRRIFANLLETLPVEWRGADHRIIQNNRNGLMFANRSVIDLLAAANNPDLGASRALNMMHATECALWRSLAGVESLKASLARQNPHRLYLWESVANGFNWYYNFVQQAKRDRHIRFIFIGFWANPTYSIDKQDPDYKVYWDGRLS